MMRQRHRILWPCAFLALSAASRPARPAGEAGGFESVLGELRQLAPRADRGATVEHLILRRDVAEFHLDRGTLLLLTPVAGRTIGAVFTGTGTVTFRPPLPMERAELVRVLHDSLVAAPITAAVFIFTDSTGEELARRADFHAVDDRVAVSNPVDAALGFLVDGLAGWVEPALMTPLLNGTADGFFAGYVMRAGGEDLMLQVNPQASEEVRLLRRGRLPRQRVQVVSQFQRAEHLRDSISAGDEHPDPLELEHYRIEATIQNNLGFAAAAQVRLRARGDSARWARFELFDGLQVDSVLGDAGAPARFVRPRNSSELWLNFNPALAPGREGSLRVVYHGNLLEWGSLLGARAMDRWVFIKSTEAWFPRYGWLQPADMDLTFHTPANDHFVTIGRRIELHTDGNVQTTRWVTEVPTAEAAFNLGEFEELEITDPRIPPVTVQINTDAHRSLTRVFGYAQRNPREQVGGDVANSLAFFTRVFGPPLFGHYYATEIPYGHGQAFPGLIHLSWWTFQSVSETGEAEVFRAHEMAHQWWGIGVAPADYRDAWLAEGVADFAGLWYMQLILEENDKYFKLLGDWARLIRSARNDAPPIGLGYRVGQIDPAHYQLVVYRKGAWVMHMLRNLLLDFRTMKEDRFASMMRDFYATYRGRRASTRDFQRLVERHVGLSMDWFFDQWVYATAIPTYTLSWHTTPAANGGVILGFRVRQEHVPEDFIMPVPLLIELPDSGRVVVRVNMRGTHVEGDIPLSTKPVRVELNPLQSVLAEVKEEIWRQAPVRPGAKVPR